MSKVVFYADKPGCEHPDNDVRDAVLEHFNTNIAYWCHATETAGFESGVDWDGLVREGAVAVVIYDCNDACAYGVKLEAENAGLKTYELITNQLFDLEDLEIKGSKHILDLGQLKQK